MTTEDRPITPPAGDLLAGNMREAYRQRMQREDDFLRHAEKAPALFKPEGIRDAQEKFTKAAQEMARWSV